MAKNTVVHRITITEQEILGTIETLHHAQINGESINADSLSFLKKLQLKAYEMHLGTATPAYVATGRAAARVNLDSLGATSEEKEYASKDTRDPLSAEVLDELEEASRKMLEELAAEGNANVVLAERRNCIRIEQEVQEAGSIAGPSDEDLFSQL